jgi:hypothetical protein
LRNSSGGERGHLIEHRPRRLDQRGLPLGGGRGDPLTLSLGGATGHAEIGVGATGQPFPQ